MRVLEKMEICNFFCLEHACKISDLSIQDKKNYKQYVKSLFEKYICIFISSVYSFFKDSLHHVIRVGIFFLFGPFYSKQYLVNFIRFGKTILVSVTEKNALAINDFIC